MRSVKSFIAAGAATLLSQAAFAADMAIAPPPYAPPVVEDFGGWYLRGDIGFSNQRVDRLNNVLDRNNTSSVQTLNFNSAGIFGLGVGYQVNSWFRADVTGEYRGNSQCFGSDHITFPGGVGTDTYHATKNEWVVLANAYVDLGTWWCVTPFIGAGVGAAYNHLANFRDDGLTTFNGLTAGTQFAADGNKTSLAWAVHAGLAYKVTNNFTVELAYRYLDLGSAVTGNTNFAFSSPNVLGTHAWTVNDLTSQDLRVGLRWTCCDVPPPPPPLVRKG